MTEVPPLPELGQRWTMARKAGAVEAVRAGRLTLDEVCKRYALSVEEFDAWKRALETHGVAGLRSTRTQLYRETAPGAPQARRGKPRKYNACNHN